MRTKTIIKLVAILILLLLVWKGQKVWNQKQSIKNSSWNDSKITEVNPDQINKITLNEKGESLEINKQNNQWLVDGTAANENQINDLLEIVKEPKVELISENQDRYKEIGIDEDHSQKVTFWQENNEKVIIFISQKDKSIFRVQDNPNVYRLTQPLSLSLNASTWQVTPTPTPEPSPSEAPNSTQTTDTK